MARAVKRLYIDASCIIYLTEGTSTFTSPMRARIVEHLQNADTALTGDANWQRCTEIAVEVIKPATSD